VGVIVERQCPKCDQWEHAASVWGVDYFVLTDSGPAEGTYEINDPRLTDEYTRDIVRSLLIEAGAA
jgi:hypothetical protein